MSNGIVPKNEPPNWLDQLNLPKMIAGPAGEAISRLIAGVADIPVAWLEQKAAEIRDKTAGATTVSSALANEAADFARKDAALVERATHCLIAKELRRQANKEAIAQKAVEFLKDEPTADEHPGRPDDDWLNVFEQYAEQASSEKLQYLWARVLAGEIRRPKSFSLRTLRFVAELDQETAELFEEYADAIVSCNFIPNTQNEGPKLTQLLQLEDCGLLTGVNGTLAKIVPMSAGGIVFHLADRAIHLVGKEGIKFNIPCIRVTKVGQELASILKKPFNRVRLEEFVSCVPKGALDRIDLGVSVPRPNGLGFFRLETVWKKEEPAQNP